MKMGSVLVLLAVLLGGGRALGEPLDLRQAVAEAVRRQPQVEAAEAEARAAAAAVGAARSGRLPRLLFSESFYATDEPAGSLFISMNQEDLRLSQDADTYNYPPSRKDFETRLTLEQNLYDPDVGYGVKRAEKGAAVAAAGVRQTRQEVAFAAFRAYLEVRQAEAALAWVESSRAEAGELLRLARERQAAGIGLKADVLRAEAQQGRSERMAIAAKNDLRLARLGLGLALGRDGEEVEIAENRDVPPLPPELPPVPMARADLEALALSVDEAELGYQQGRAAYLPRLGLSASYALHDEDLPFGTDAAAWTVRAGLNWELFDGFRRSHQLEQAAAEQQARSARLREASRQARFQLEEARLRAREAGEQKAVAEKELAAVGESRRLLLERYEAGLEELSTLLAVQEALDRARYESVAAANRELLATGNIAYRNGTFLQTLGIDGEDKP